MPQLIVIDQIDCPQQIPAGFFQCQLTSSVYCLDAHSQVFMLKVFQYTGFPLFIR